MSGAAMHISTKRMFY